MEIGKEVSSILTDTKFNGTAVFSNSASFQVGANEGETIVAAVLRRCPPRPLPPAACPRWSTSSVSTAGVASAAFDAMTIDTIDTMIKNVSSVSVATTARSRTASSTV